MTSFAPFADNSAAQTIADLTIENGTERVALYGSLDLTRDKAGLARARALKAAVDAIVRALEGQENLPERQPPPPKPGRVKNPFA